MKVINLNDLLKEDNFSKLLGMLLLFDKNSVYYKWSGFVTAALLDFEEDNGIPITILAINTGPIMGWLTIKRTRKELEDLLNKCIEFIGKTKEDSFQLEK